MGDVDDRDAELGVELSQVFEDVAPLREAFVGKFEAGCGDLAADEVFVVVMDGFDFAPDGLFDLLVGWRGGDDQCLAVGHEPPEGSECGGVCLT